MNPKVEQDTMRKEYDFSGGVRGKHYTAYRHGTNLVLLEPDVAKEFPTARAVNDALRGLLQTASGRVNKGKLKAAKAGGRS